MYLTSADPEIKIVNIYSLKDDHEVGDNSYRDGMADQNNTEASYLQYDVEFGGEKVAFDQRKMNAVRSYFEWLPIRQVEMDDNLRIWRTFSLGNLVDLIMLDTRQYDRSITDLYWNTGEFVMKPMQSRLLTVF